VSRPTNSPRPRRLAPDQSDPDLILASPDSTLEEIVPLMDEGGWFDLDSGVDAAHLTVTTGMLPLPGHLPNRPLWVVVGSDPAATFAPVLEHEGMGLVAIVSTPPTDRGGVLVGLHGFSSRAPDPDRTFPLTMIDDWGVDDVLGAAWDAAGRGSDRIRLLVDLAVLDPVYEPGCPRTRPGGLSLRQLARAVRWAGRQTGLAIAGLVKATSLPNLAHVVMSLSAGLASR
jgi:hypothetical protein